MRVLNEPFLNICYIERNITICHATMETLKQQVKETLDNLPEDATVDDIIAHVRFVELIYKRIEQADAGDTIPHEHAGEIIRGERTLER